MPGQGLPAWDDRQHNVRGGVAIVVDRLLGHDGSRLQTDVVGAGVEVPQEVGEVTAGNLDANAVPLAEYFCRIKVSNQRA